MLALTPVGNATERLIALAYARRAGARFASDQMLAFGTGKLGPGFVADDLPESPTLIQLIRTRMIKADGSDPRRAQKSFYIAWKF